MFNSIAYKKCFKFGTDETRSIISNDGLRESKLSNVRNSSITTVDVEPGVQIYLDN